MHHEAKPHLGDLVEHTFANGEREMEKRRQLSTMRERANQRFQAENSNSSQAVHMNLFKYVLLHACSLTYHASEILDECIIDKMRYACVHVSASCQGRTCTTPLPRLAHANTG